MSSSRRNTSLHAPACAGFHGARRSGGKSLVSILFFIVLVGGIYSVFFKNDTPTEAVGSSVTTTQQKNANVVVIYTTKSCEPCDRAKAWMKLRGVKFEERDVEHWPPYQKELEAYGGRVVPVIVVNGEAQHGFFSAYLQDALDGKKMGDQ